MNPVRRTVYLILCGVIAFVLAIVVLILNRDTPSDLLAVLGIVGAVAIIVVSLPTNGNGKK
jgi:hypothetical protein